MARAATSGQVVVLPDVRSATREPMPAGGRVLGRLAHDDTYFACVEVRHGSRAALTRDDPLELVTLD
jgi:hypothetical protein